MATNKSAHSLHPAVNLLAPPTKQTFNKLLVLGYVPSGVTTSSNKSGSKTNNPPDKTASVFTFNDRGEKLRTEKQPAEAKEQHSREKDIATLIDDQARACEIDEAEHWLIKEASSLYGSAAEGRSTIIDLQEIVELAGQGRIDSRPEDRVARQAREAIACLHQIFSNLSANGKNLWDPEVRIRMKLMPAIASIRLHELAQVNPNSADDPSCRDIRENAQSLLGEIITKAILQKVSKTSDGNSSKSAAPLWNDIISLATDTSNEAGLGAVRQLRDWMHTANLEKEEYKAGEKVLRQIATTLIGNGDRLTVPAVRIRVRAVGPIAIDFLQELVKATSNSSHTINLENPPQRLNATNIINEIGLDITQEDLRVLGIILRSSTDNELFTKIFQQIVARASDISNPLGLSAVRALKSWTEERKPDTNECKIGEQALRAIAARLVPNGQALDNTNIRERIKLVGSQAITALKMIVDKNGANALFCQNLIASIEADDLALKRMNKIRP